MKDYERLYLKYKMKYNNLKNMSLENKNEINKLNKINNQKGGYVVYDRTQYEYFEISPIPNETFDSILYLENGEIYNTKETYNNQCFLNCIKTYFYGLKFDMTIDTTTRKQIRNRYNVSELRRIMSDGGKNAINGEHEEIDLYFHRNAIMKLCNEFDLTIYIHTVNMFGELFQNTFNQNVGTGGNVIHLLWTGNHFNLLTKIGDNGGFYSMDEGTINRIKTLTRELVYGTETNKIIKNPKQYTDNYFELLLRSIIGCDLNEIYYPISEYEKIQVINFLDKNIKKLTEEYKQKVNAYKEKLSDDDKKNEKKDNETLRYFLPIEYQITDISGKLGIVFFNIDK